MAVIAAYNTDFTASLPLVSSQIDKLEGETVAAFEQGNLSLSDFDFFQQSNGGATTIDIFDMTPEEFVSWNPAIDGFDTIDNPVLAFQRTGGPSFGYYVSKNAGNFSVWIPESLGLNPSYTDEAGTRGDISNNSLTYDPKNNGTSHISFYLAVPEPLSFFGVVVAAIVLIVHRRLS